MLVLTRERGQVVLIGTDISVKVVSVNRDNGRVELGVEAPRQVLILRSEKAGAARDGSPGQPRGKSGGASC